MATGNSEFVDKLLKRIKDTGDGPEFIGYLKALSKDNYNAFIAGSGETNDVHRGYGMAIDLLLKSFEECDTEEVKKETEQDKAASVAHS